MTKKHDWYSIIVFWVTVLMTAVVWFIFWVLLFGVPGE